MTHEQTRTPDSGSDPVDQLLNDAFDEALRATPGADLVEITMSRIAVEQRLRAIVFALAGVLAVVICVVTSLPLLELIQTLFSGLTGPSSLADAAEGFAGWRNNLPELVLVLALGAEAGGTWLFLEEAF